jgi:hypothetical protein
MGFPARWNESGGCVQVEVEVEIQIAIEIGLTVGVIMFSQRGGDFLTTRSAEGTKIREGLF